MDAPAIVTASLVSTLLTMTGCPASPCPLSGSCIDLGTADESVEDGDPETGGNACLDLIDCAEIVDPEAVSSLAAMYGAEGSCEDCWAECEGLRAGYAEANPEIPECALFSCGDGILDVGEMCDGTEACSSWCQFTQHECTPLGLLGCGTGDCGIGVLEGIPDSSHFFVCRASSSGSGVVGDPCVGDNECSASSPLCIAGPHCEGSSCCTRYCYLGDTTQDYGCPLGYACEPLVDAIANHPWVPGVEFMGVCL